MRKYILSIFFASITSLYTIQCVHQQKKNVVEVCYDKENDEVMLSDNQQAYALCEKKKKAFWQKHTKHLVGGSIVASSAVVLFLLYLLYQNPDQPTHEKHLKPNSSNKKQKYPANTNHVLGHNQAFEPLPIREQDKQKKYLPRDGNSSDALSYHLIRNDRSKKIPLLTRKPADFVPTLPVDELCYGIAQNSNSCRTNKHLIMYQKGTIENGTKEVNILADSYGYVPKQKSLWHRYYWDTYTIRDKQNDTWLTSDYGLPLLKIKSPENTVVIPCQDGTKQTLKIRSNDFRYEHITDHIKSTAIHTDNNSFIIFYVEWPKKSEIYHLLMPPISLQKYTSSEPYISPEWHDHVTLQPDGNNFFYLSKNKRDDPLRLLSDGAFPYIKMFPGGKIFLSRHPELFTKNIPKKFVFGPYTLRRQVLFNKSNKEPTKMQFLLESIETNN